jgi:hypothetical protein
MFSASDICNATALYPKIYICDIQISVLYYEVQGSNPCGCKEFSLIKTHSDRFWGPHSLQYNGYRVSFPEVKRPGHGVAHPLPFSPVVRMTLFTFMS